MSKPVQVYLDDDDLARLDEVSGRPRRIARPHRAP